MLTIMASCWLCRQPLWHSQHGVCSVCLRHLPALPPCCPRCGLPGGQPLRPCGRCLQKPPPWQALTAVGDYRPPLSTLLKQFKFHAKTELAPLLARLILLRWLAGYRQYAYRDSPLWRRPEIVLSVPLHRRRQWARGFNQTALLAAPLARWLGCRYQPLALRRSRPTRIQQRLNAAARRHNLHDAFSCSIALTGKRVALLDDVVTTGSTVAEISRLLLARGAADVQIWCVCRTL
ncbi:DNA utilization protein GntX [Affinibrenneria salicis]|uniref:DNA utilization protein GntX n=1 Tax=Affinibrenneria salicis TaxID=2590031 RepID=A0A5J5FT38_9GAMM|nr:DNA utilization protein GntX [Affinibrenneria salicis]KAA8996395.1 DNA utilization protein GntX [Affinibrenneria salicis]